MTQERAVSVGERPLSALDAIFTRRSVRSYTEQRLDESTVAALLDAAVQAPTAMHAEPWAFVVVQDRAALKRISDRAKAKWTQDADAYRLLHPGETPTANAFTTRLASPDFCVFYDAGTLIAIGTKAPGPFVEADCWLAAENLMIAATALGLGSCCIGSAVPALNSKETRAELGLSADLEIVAPIIVGVPRDAAAETARKNPEIVSWLRGQ